MTRLTRRRWLALGVFAALVLVAFAASARPGGGGSYSAARAAAGVAAAAVGAAAAAMVGPSSSCSCGSASSIRRLGIPLTLAVIGWFVWTRRRRSSERDWNAGVASPVYDARQAFPPYVPPPFTSTPRVSFDAITAHDPKFSRIVFEDFPSTRCTPRSSARGLGQLNRLSAYLAPNTVTTLQQMTRGPVDNVIVGALRLIEATASSTTDRASWWSSRRTTPRRARGSTSWSDGPWPAVRARSRAPPIGFASSAARTAARRKTPSSAARAGTALAS